MISDFSQSTCLVHFPQFTMKLSDEQCRIHIYIIYTDCKECYIQVNRSLDWTLSTCWSGSTLVYKDKVYQVSAGLLIFYTDFKTQYSHADRSGFNCSCYTSWPEASLFTEYSMAQKDKGKVLSALDSLFLVPIYTVFKVRVYPGW